MQVLEAQILDLLRKLLRKLGCGIDEDASPQDVFEALVKIISSGRTSWRPEGFAWKHSLSPSFIYEELRAGRLRARKPAAGVTIITDADEAEWLAGMPPFEAKPETAAKPKIEAKPKIDEATVSGCDSKSAPEIPK